MVETASHASYQQRRNLFGFGSRLRPTHPTSKTQTGKGCACDHAASNGVELELFINGMDWYLVALGGLVRRSAYLVG